MKCCLGVPVSQSWHQGVLGIPHFVVHVPGKAEMLLNMGLSHTDGVKVIWILLRSSMSNDIFVHSLPEFSQSCFSYWCLDSGFIFDTRICFLVCAELCYLLGVSPGKKKITPGISYNFYSGSQAAHMLRDDKSNYYSTSLGLICGQGCKSSSAVNSHGKGLKHNFKQRLWINLTVWQLLKKEYFWYLEWTNCSSFITKFGLLVKPKGRSSLSASQCLAESHGPVSPLFFSIYCYFRTNLPKNMPHSCSWQISPTG